MRRALALMGVAALGLSACATAPVVPVPYRSAQPAAEASPQRGGAATQAASEPSQASVAAPSAAETGDSCRHLAESLTPEERVGQLFMVGVDTGGLDPMTRSAIVDFKVGSVVLLGNTTDGSRAIRTLTAELGSLGTSKLPLLVAVDQEGGTVQRLKGPGFSTMPPARDQGAMAPGDLEVAARTWAGELKEAGVHYDLAPVGDLVPEAKRTTNEPIGRLQRDFGSDPVQVSEAVASFVTGMQAGGVVTAVKHFPGLGEVVTNTDFGAAEDTDVTRDSAHLDPFRAAIEAGADSVMISSAVFTELDPDNEGVFSSVIITDLLRGELGFEGVVIADDLGAAAAVKGVSPADRAVRFIEAGGDLVINADPRIMREMSAATLAAAGERPAFSDQVVESTSRVLRLKAAAGLVECS